MKKRNKQTNLILYCISSVFQRQLLALRVGNEKFYGYSMVMSWFLIFFA